MGSDLHFALAKMNVRPHQSEGLTLLISIFSQPSRLRMTWGATLFRSSSNCSDNAPFISLAWEHTHPDLVTSNELGELWLVVGTDSAFEGKTTLYYQAVEAILTPVN